MTQPNSTDPVLRACVIILTSIALMAALFIARDVFAPLLLAGVVGIVLAPTADAFDRLGLPRWASVFVMMLLLFAALASLAYFLEPYVWQLVDSLPAIKFEIRSVLYDFRALIRGVDQVNNEMKEALTGSAGTGDGEEGAAPPMPTLTDALFLAPQFLAQLLIFLGGVFFFLLSRNEVYGALAARIGDADATEIILRRFCKAEDVVARYFLTITGINLGLGVALATGLSLLGMPGAVVWGLFAALFNFILYLGPLVVASSLILGGVLAFDGAVSFVPVAMFLALNLIESQFVTPTLVGRNMAINPLLVFVSLCFWLWLWGPLGGIVAIPITLIVLKLFDLLGEDPLPGRGAPHDRPLPK